MLEIGPVRSSETTNNLGRMSLVSLSLDRLRGWNHVGISANLNTTSHRHIVFPTSFEQEKDIITTLYRRYARNDAEIKLKSRWNYDNEIIFIFFQRRFDGHFAIFQCRLKQRHCACWVMTLKHHMKLFSTSFWRHFAIFQRHFNTHI